MERDLIIFARDANLYVGIGMIPKEQMKDEFLVDYLEVKDVGKGFPFGSIVHVGDGKKKFDNTILKIVKVSDCQRLKNLEKAFYHFMDCLDAGSYTFNNPHQMDFILGKPYCDDEIFYDGHSILEAYSKVFASMSEDKKTIKTINLKLKEMEKFEEDFYGLPFGEMGCKTLVPHIMQKFGKKKSEVSDFVHSKTVEYLMHSGAEVFGLAKASLKANNQCQNDTPSAEMLEAQASK